MEPLYTPEQIANHLQVHHLTVLKLLKSGQLGGVKIGRIYRVTESAFQEFLKSNKITTKV